MGRYERALELMRLCMVVDNERIAAKHVVRLASE